MSCQGCPLMAYCQVVWLCSKGAAGDVMSLYQVSIKPDVICMVLPVVWQSLAQFDCWKMYTGIQL